MRNREEEEDGEDGGAGSHTHITPHHKRALVRLIAVREEARRSWLFIVLFGEKNEKEGESKTINEKD